ncbi:MAG: SIMPL domain-containing protein [Acidobacteriales bacterium]|nr:SIMPL domain-containing protein [Terriglobales bacterium]
MFFTPVEFAATRRRFLTPLLTVLLGCALTAHAQNSPQGEAPPASLKVHGQSSISVEPDQVQFDIGVVGQAISPQAATDLNAKQSAVLARELKAALPAANVKSINFSVNPNYDYPRDAPPSITGYTASSTVRVLLNDISKLRIVIDIALKSGANSINRLTFTLRNEKNVRARALALAAAQAQAGAEALAASLKLKLGRLVSIEEGQPVVISPPREFSFEKLQSTSLEPISAGTIDVHADVDLTYEAAP